MRAVPAALVLLAAVSAALVLLAAASAAAPAVAGFAYAPVQSDRSLFIHGPTDRLGIAEVAARLAPKGVMLRWDRRVDTSRRARDVHADWKMLLFDFGLAWERHGDEVHVRPAGLPPGEVEIATVGRGVADWSVAQGETLREALARWSAMVGVELVWLTDRTYRVHETRRFRGTFAEAVGALARSLSGLARAPEAAIAPDGRMLSVTHRIPGRTPGIATEAER